MDSSVQQEYLIICLPCTSHIVDGGFDHVLHVYKDTDTGDQRLYATGCRDELEGVPIWTWFCKYFYWLLFWQNNAYPSRYTG